MKNFVLLFALLVCLGHCFNFQGYDAMSTLSDPNDPTNCLLTLRINNITREAMNFQQSGNLQNNCNYRNMNFVSLFKGEELNDAVPFNAPVSGVLTASFDAAALQRNNGTGCVYLYQTEYSYDFYICHFQFSAVHIYLQVYGFNNFTFTSGISGLIIPNYANAQVRSQAYNSINVNSSFPAIIANLSSSCGNTSDNNITDLNKTVYISTAVNLTAYLPDMYLAYTIIKKGNSFVPGDYRTIKSNTNAILFGDASVSTCYALPMMYNSIIPDLSYCSQGIGCKVSFILTNQKGDFYLLESNGVLTPSGNNGTNTGGNGNNTGNNTGNGNGNGNGGNNGTVGNNTGNGPVGTNGLVMVINFVTLVLAAVYLA